MYQIDNKKIRQDLEKLVQKSESESLSSLYSECSFDSSLSESCLISFPSVLRRVFSSFPMNTLLLPRGSSLHDVRSIRCSDGQPSRAFLNTKQMVRFGHELALIGTKWNKSGTLRSVFSTLNMK